ncbi:MAG TPA: polyprenyl synthetase family protein [Streptosporangiaceae bacterium]|nr:polyprenyl synthetase family protein [Streptosporangiaceae bacterium]
MLMERRREAVTGRSAQESLAWGRTAVDAGLRDAVAKLPASARRVASYHFGWQDSNGKPAHGDAGKGIRPALALLSAQAAGGDLEAAVPAAIAVELVHNFSILHDDVMDRDQMRRHRPAAWTVFGTADAILAGDALLALAFGCLADGGPALAAQGAQRLSQCVAELCQGQSLDLSFEQRDHIEMDECLAMAAAKTGALFGCACSLGALAGGAGAGPVKALNDFGTHLGLVFQLTDDLLGIWGDPGSTGKPAHSDLTSRKKSLPVTAALNSATDPGDQAAELYRRTHPFQPDELPQIADLIERAGGRKWACRTADEELESAAETLTTAGFSAQATTALRELAQTLLSRDH